MATVVIGDPALANACYFKKLRELSMAYRTMPPRSATCPELTRLHAVDYVAHTESGFSEEWVGQRPDLVERARQSAGSALRAANAVWRHDVNKVFVPGSGRPHAGYRTSDRMCVFNDIALAAAWLQRRGWRVAVIDLDGLYAEPLESLLTPIPDISLFSIHEKPLVPALTNSNNGVWNFPLHDYAADYEMLQYVDSINSLLLVLLPDVVLLNVGATGHESDELTALEYTIDGIYEAVVRISQTVDELCGSRMICFGGVASVGNEWGSTISAAATHAISLPYLKSSATRHSPRITTEEEAQ